jgi:hypothetical protein
MFTIESDDPVSMLYVIKQRIERRIGLNNRPPLHEREVECLEDDVIPAIEKYLAIAEEVFEEFEKDYINE